jgi:hypothetical protein
MSSWSRKDAVGRPVVAHELPDVRHGVQLGAFRRQRQQGEVVGHGERVREVPAGLVEQHHGVAAWLDHLADLGQVQVHRHGVAEGQDESRALAFAREGRAEDGGRRVALVLRR